MNPPQDLDEESIRRIARSFYVVRMVRYGLLLVTLTVFLVVTLAQDAPGWVSVALVLSLVALAGAVVATHRRYVSSQRPPSGDASSR